MTCFCATQVAVAWKEAIWDRCRLPVATEVDTQYLLWVSHRPHSSCSHPCSSRWIEPTIPESDWISCFSTHLPNHRGHCYSNCGYAAVSWNFERQAKSNIDWCDFARCCDLSAGVPLIVANSSCCQSLLLLSKRCYLYRQMIRPAKRKHDSELATLGGPTWISFQVFCLSRQLRYLRYPYIYC